MTSAATPEIYRNRDFLQFVSARFLAMTAMQIQSVAIGWQIYNMEGTAFALGMVGLCQFVPMLLMTLPAGDIIDRTDQRLIYSLSLALQGLCSALFIGLTLYGVDESWPFYAVLVLFGASRGFSGPSGQSLLPFLVPPSRLPRAIAFNSSAFTTAMIAGPALGGFLYILGPVATYSVCFAAFVIPALNVFSLGGRRRTPSASSASARERVIEGIRFVWQRPVVLGAMSLDLFAVLLGGATALLPIYARDILHVDVTGLGFLRSAPAVGAALTALALARWPLKDKVGSRMFAAVAVFGIATIVFGLSTNFILSLAALFLMGASDMISIYVRSALVQFATPDSMRGRVSSVNMLFIGASNELGEFESGLTAEWFGTVPAVVIGGLGTLGIVALWMHFFPHLRRIDQLHDTASK